MGEIFIFMGEIKDCLLGEKVFYFVRNVVKYIFMIVGYYLFFLFR